MSVGLSISLAINEFKFLQFKFGYGKGGGKRQLDFLYILRKMRWKGDKCSWKSLRPSLLWSCALSPLFRSYFRFLQWHLSFRFDYWMVRHHTINIGWNHKNTHPYFHSPFNNLGCFISEQFKSKGRPLVIPYLAIWRKRYIGKNCLLLILVKKDWYS